MTESHVKPGGASRSDGPGLAGAAKAGPSVEVVLKRSSELNADGRFVEADALVIRAMLADPKHRDLAVHHLKLAQGRRDYYEAAKRAQLVIRRFPKSPIAYRLGIRALQAIGRYREAGKLADAALKQFPGQPWPLHAKAENLAAMAAYAEAEKIWRDVQREFPDDFRGWTGAAALFSHSGRLEAAEATLVEAVSMFAGEERVHLDFADSAENLRRWDIADQRWEHACKMFPDNSTARLRHAVLPAQSNKPDEAFARLQVLHEKFPDDIGAHAQYIDLLRRENRLDEALAYAEKSTAAFPQAVRLALEHARTEAGRSNTAGAIVLLQNFLSANSGAQEIYTELALILSQADRFAEAEAVCEQALTRFPFHANYHVAHATLAMWQEQWTAALERWKHADKWAPGTPRIRFGIATAEAMLADQARPEGGALSSTAAPAVRHGDALSDLMMNFESMGGSEGGWGCEFGFVQRRFGAEPVGLMRWSDMPADRLLEALETRFDGVGSPEQTELVPPEGHQEYFAKDKRFEIITHTHVNSGYERLDKVVQMTCRRMDFLRRKFLEDLESSRKIFAYKPTPVPEMSLIEQIFGAMRKYGDNTLLFVRPADADHAAGTVEIARPGLMIGYIAESATAKAITTRVPNFSSWLQICWGAYRLGKSQDEAEKAQNLFPEADAAAG